MKRLIAHSATSLILALLLFSIPTPEACASKLTVTNYSVIYYEAGRFYFSVYQYTISDWRWSDPEPSICNAGPTGATCSLYVELRDGPQGKVYNRVEKFRVDSAPNATMGDLLKAANAKGFSAPHRGRDQVEDSLLDPVRRTLCVTLAVGFNGSRETSPIGSCIPLNPIPPQQSCSVTGNTTIDHKIITDDVKISEASVNLSLTCNLTGSVELYAGTESYRGTLLDARREITSTFSINGASAGEGVLIPVRGNQTANIQVKSILSLPKIAGRTAPGPFSGSTILKIIQP